jgi:predicted Zn-dependent protease
LTLAAQATAKDTWTSVRSRNFFLIGNASEKEIKQVGTRLEQFREVFTLLFKGMNFNATVPTTVVVFKSDSSYRPFKPNANTAGYFQPGPDVNYITLTTEVKGEQNPYNVIFHEYTHLLVNNTMGNAPTWFNEGLAEYYSTFSISGDQKVELGKPIASHVYLLRDKILPLRTLFQVDQKSPYYNERDKQSVFYAESWALVHYLILGNNGQRTAQISPFINLVDAGVPMEQAFQQSFQSTFEKMEKELREYVRHDRYPIVTGEFKQKVTFDTEMQTAPISDAEAQAYLGDLLLHSNRSESESYLQKALALDPGLEMANASLAMLRVRQGKLDEARQSLERAVSANSQNYLIHYYYAYALSRQGMGDTQLVTSYSPATVAKMRQELQKAIQLRPDFLESYRLLAFVNLVDGSQLDESIALLKRVLTASPGRNDLLLILAQIYLRKEDYKTSRQILERLSQNSSDAEVAQRAKVLLGRVASIEEQLARYRAQEKPLANAGASRERNVATESDARRAVEERDPSVYLREALRKPAEGEKQVQGTLVRVECEAKGVTLVIRIASGMLRLKAAGFEDLDIVAFTTDAGGEISCGPRKPENPVVVCYLPASDVRTKVDGKARSIEFVPKDFKLNP